MNLDTIIDKQWCYKIWQRGGYNPTHAKQNFPGDPEEPNEFLEPTRKPKVIYTDNSLEFGKSCKELSWNHCTSTSHRSETNGIAERAVRRVKEGTSAALSQSGLDKEWWADSMECYCYLRNIQDLVSRRFGIPFNGPVIPCGAMVEYHPISTEGHIEITSIWSKSLARYFPRFCIVCGENLERRHHDRRH